MNIDFVKWKVGYAEGFSLKSEDIEKGEFSIYIPVPFTFLKSWCNHFRTDIWKYIYSPLLNQKAIEGIEKETFYEFNVYWDKSEKCYESQVFNSASAEGNLYLEIQYTEMITINEAKEEALKYVHEQEKSDG